MPSTKPRSALSLTEQLALLENPAPTDFDPEALEQEHWDGEDSDGSEGSGDEGQYNGREHYVVVGKSKLRKGHTALLDPKYNGARVSRDKLYDEDEGKDTESEPSGDEDGEVEEDGEKSDDESTGGAELDSEADIREGTPNSDEDDEIDSDDALGSEEERFSGYKFRGSLTTTKAGGVNSSGESSGVEDGIENSDEDKTEDDEESDGDNDEEDDEENEDEDEDEDEDGDEDGSADGQEEEIARRNQLRKMMAEEQKNVVANISKAARADADKGTAVRQQQKTFDSFLSIRIKLQKALISINSLPKGNASTTSEIWKTAEKTALDLWNTLHNLRSDLSDSRTSSKRKHDDAEETSTDALWAKMRKLDRDATPWRDSTLDKWSSKTAGIATTSLAGKLNNTVSAPRSLTASLHETLSSDSDRLIARTRTPRSMAPTCTAAEDAEIFDDTDFYQLLLKALVDRRMVDGAAGSGAVRWTTAMRDSKKKKVVDTKASKGRKLRYQVQEKIQNFMAPMDDNSWHEQQIGELFSSLLGQKVRVDEEDEDQDEEDVEMDGLRLFRS